MLIVIWFGIRTVLDSYIRLAKFCADSIHYKVKFRKVIINGLDN